jgi:hypothetical protein
LFIIFQPSGTKDDLETVEKKMRRGTNLFPSGARAAEQIIETSLVDEFFAESEVGTEPNNNLDETLPEIPLPESNEEPDNFTKFRSILFKEALKTEGTRQVTFNMTALDRQPKSKKFKHSSKSVREDFIDDDPGDKTSDEESESEVDSNTGNNEESDSASLKLSSDEVYEDENEREVAFSEKKPNCSNCSMEITNIADFLLCSSIECRSHFHRKCFDKMGCIYCG